MATEQLAKFVESTAFDKLPGEIVTKAKAVEVQPEEIT